jgi:large subunit ribosomal protein L33
LDGLGSGYIASTAAVGGAEERSSMAKATDIRPVVRLKSVAGTGYTYVTRKNRRNDPDRLVLRKYDPVAREHVDFREER